MTPTSINEVLAKNLFNFPYEMATVLFCIEMRNKLEKIMYERIKLNQLVLEQLTVRPQNNISIIAAHNMRLMKFCLANKKGNMRKREELAKKPI